MQLGKCLGFDIVNFTYDPCYLGIYIGWKNPLGVRVVNWWWMSGSCHARAAPLSRVEMSKVTATAAQSITSAIRRLSFMT